jgi:hypothetical protein
MIEAAFALAAVLGGLGTVFAGLAAMRVADAWKIWAGRCDPKNQNFQAPRIGRSTKA